MKNSILILGIALVSLTNVCNATTIVNLPVNLFQSTFFAYHNTEVKLNEVVKFKKPYVEDLEVFNPETVLKYQPKTIHQISIEGDKIVENSSSDDIESIKKGIVQSDLIIENKVSNDTYPLYIGRTVEDEIAELELIIDSHITNETRSLGFKIIKSNPRIINSFNIQNFVGMK